MKHLKLWENFEDVYDEGERGLVSIEMFEKGKPYTYNTIEMFVEDKHYDFEEHGKNSVGENFIVLSNPNEDEVISFVLFGYSNQNIYECVYSDMT